MRSVVSHARRIVVKVGSSLVTAEGRGLDNAALSRWAGQIAALTAQGKEVVLVSSGAIAEGIARLGWKKRPKAVNETSPHQLYINIAQYVAVPRITHLSNASTFVRKHHRLFCYG